MESQIVSDEYTEYETASNGGDQDGPLASPDEREGTADERDREMKEMGLLQRQVFTERADNPSQRPEDDWLIVNPWQTELIHLPHCLRQCMHARPIEHRRTE